MTAPRTSIPPFDPDSPAVKGVLTEIQSLAAKRDAERQSPADSIRKLRELGIAAALLPRERGGAGLPLRRLFQFALELAEADASIAHSFRNHFLVSEVVLAPDRIDQNPELLRAVLDGHLIGAASNELGTVAPAGEMRVEAKLNPDGDGYRLSTDKGYSTGNLYVSFLIVNAQLPDGSPATARIPVDRAGVEIPDDWDGIGQRLTGSGSTRFDNVRVERHEIGGPRRSEFRPNTGTFAQLWLTIVIVGSMKAAVAEAIAFLRQRRRNYYHGLADLPKNESSVQEIVGQVLANTYVAEAAVRAAADALEAAWSLGAGTKQEGLAREAVLAAANAKVVIDPLALETASLVFEVGGASATARGSGLDRHWRNIRTLASHNPSSYKRRVLGDHALNGAELPAYAYF